MIFSNDELHIILKKSNWEICKHSSFFEILLNQTSNSEIQKLVNCLYNSLI